MSETATSELGHIDDHLLLKLCDLAKMYWEDPRNAERLEAWHLKEYGCLPPKEGRAKGGEDEAH